MKKILIPTDFSLNSYQTIFSVLKLFKDNVCDFYFLNTYSYNISGLDALGLLHVDEEWFDKPEEESIQKLGKLIEHCTFKSKDAKHRFYGITEHSSLLDAVKKQQELLNIDLIILSGGTNKKSDKENESILENVRSCPILLLPSHSSIDRKISMTIASDFKQRINTGRIDQFRKGLVGKDIEIGILVLDKQNQLSEAVADNLEAFIVYLRQFQNTKINLNYAETDGQLKAYASLHPNGIMCLVDKKPSFMRKIGVFKSDIVTRLKQLNTNSVLAIHQ